ncbi:MAG: alpha/beta hydrolase [Allosphingosinicella sp.]
MRPILLLILFLLAACAAEIREADLLRPQKGGALTAGAVAAAAPAYTLIEHRIAAPDGTRLYAVHLHQPGARATILYFGGNGYTIGRYGAWTASVFAPLGVDLMIVDHRGYGPSEGVPSASAIEGDGLAAFDYLRGLVGPEGRIIVHGHSLGSFIAGHVAANRPAAGVVLESSATTTEDWVKAGTPGVAKAFIRKVEIEPALRGRGNLANMARIEEPLLLLVGAKDRTTPLSLSQGLYAASPLDARHKTLAVIPGAGHPDVMTRPQAIEAYRAFLAGLD